MVELVALIDQDLILLILLDHLVAEHLAKVWYCEILLELIRSHWDDLIMLAILTSEEEVIESLEMFLQKNGRLDTCICLLTLFSASDFFVILFMIVMKRVKKSFSSSFLYSVTELYSVSSRDLLLIGDSDRSIRKSLGLRVPLWYLRGVLA